MHRTYFADYDERWQIVIDKVAESVPQSARILDLGCGPGALTGRLQASLPGASVVGIDAHPALVAMGRATRPGVSFVEATLGSAGTDALPDDLGRFDAVVSSAFVHYFDPRGIEALLRQGQQLLTPRGVLVTAEQLASGDPHRDTPGPAANALAPGRNGGPR